MRALHVAAGNLYGGVERILVEIARTAAPAWRHEFALCFDGRLESELRDAGAAVHMLGAVRFSRPPTVWRARRRLRGVCAAGTFDAVVCHSPWAFALAARAASGRRILWAHDALRGTHWTERRVAARPPDAVICNSRYTSDAVAAWLGNVPVDVVYAPVSQQTLPLADRADVRRELGVEDSTVVIVMACRLERWKGHHALLDAASGLDGDWTIWIAGGAQRPDEVAYLNELTARVEGLPLAGRIRFLGERRDVPRLLGAADIHCQPNIEPEPFGIAFVEALLAGVPVVTSDAGGAREIVTPDCGVLVPRNDREALRGALQALIDYPGRRATLRAAGPLRASMLCDPSTQIAALERVLSTERAEALA